MKNPFKKTDHSGLIVSAIVFSAAAAGLAYLYLTENGEQARQSFKHRFKDEVKDLASGAISKKTGISKKAIKRVADVIAR